MFINVLSLLQLQKCEMTNTVVDKFRYLNVRQLTFGSKEKLL